ncbi:DMT family transporter [Cohnella sp. REN36]|uniref:DMT family transporter n=1 Tax=Cohnella sp. REN36 TaxID=2887347 RepID=UPI001D15B057|nr:DMT family transporter [Cohnella sp. REN36]MCC3373791.1 DMT family transporter [Cohnella sp. REN36]
MKRGEGNRIALGILLVLGSGLAHAVWNLFAKTSRNKNVFLWLIHLCGCVVFLPFLVRDIARGIPPAGYASIAVSLAFQMGYAYLLPIAYQRADMSRAYPVMRGIAALCVPVLGVWIYEEKLSPAGWAGVAAIVAGLFAIGDLRRIERGAFLHAFGPILGVGAMITGYTLNDKTLLHDLSPLSLIEVSNFGFVLMLSRTALASGDIRAEWRAQWRRILIGSMLSPGSYLLFLFAMQLGPLSHLAPIREISTVFGTLLGVWLLRESGGVSRIFYATVIASGIVAIGLWGS